MNPINTLKTCLLAAFLSAVTSADTINVQFYSAVPTGDPSASATSYSGAGVVGTSGDVWNPFTTTTAHNFALQNSAGNVTPVQLSYTVGSVFNNPANENGFGGTPYQNLMDSYVFVNSTSGVPLTFTLTGLQADATYSFYFYSEANDNQGGPPNRQISIDLNGSSQSTKPANSALGTFVEGQNYLAFEGTSNSNGTLTFALSSPATGNTSKEADLNGFQIVGPNAVAPEPAFTSALGCLLLAAFLKRNRVAGIRTGR